MRRWKFRVKSPYLSIRFFPKPNIIKNHIFAINVITKPPFTSIRKAIYDYEQSEMDQFFGEVEVDESYIGPKFKKRRKKSRDYYRKINAVKRGRGVRILHQPVFGLCQRNGRVYVEFIKDEEKKTLQDTIKGKIVLESEVYTDTWKSSRGLRNQGYRREVIDHGKQQYVKENKDRKIHINGIEGFWGI